ncbi:hypothetical protein IKF32_01955 [Candidatus Saccharibacteria bacterium]|nr:hypothetical protein [Candidatus Saccharibacteria bacterium]
MKKDLATAIGTALLGAIVAYFLSNLLLVPMVAPIEEQTIKKIDSNFSLDIATPSPEVFNYRSLNPTVEVYVGDCKELNEYGECIDEETLQSLENAVEGSNQENQ